MILSADLLIDYNYGLSIYPVSVFVNIKNTITIDSYDITNLYEDITKTELNDIIIYGDILFNPEILKWFISRLYYDNYNVSIFSNENMIDFDSNLILCIGYKYTLKNKDMFETLEPRDQIILNIDNIQFLKRARQVLINNGTRAKIFFSTKAISKEIVLENKIYDLLPYDGNLI